MSREIQRCVPFLSWLRLACMMYTTRTKVFDHHENLHTNSIKVDLFMMEYVIKQNRYSIFYFRFVNYTSELLIFETFNTNTNSHVENYQPLPLCVTNRHYI